ncbi:alpha/beta hydrolase [Silicimonas algicola]|uniref:Lysophospholipase n=1 Tax=Silicimonas algicola TaxID=1826607 RepID=A0A316GCH0_9RHOB|nr:alpha/beta hydrolase [Silicimonas algicola]AZQ66072.1 alpha/beta hydrolase [Silicimonas algicola]PWK58372.1 lysophospholipase [Silicimonas algicola]
MDKAPYRADLAQGPEDASTFWVRANDGVRLRLTIWRQEGAGGTVLLFPGRTEFIEKYGRLARDLTAQGLAVATIDWRGQGFSDRLAGDPSLGHVGAFPDYQRDVDALLSAAREARLPEPFNLLAHSMGGSIGLRALCEGLPVARAVFTAPMWAINLPVALRPLPFVLPPVYRLARRGLDYAPGTRPTNYIADTGFVENLLTTDRDSYDILGAYAAAEPMFALGGPSVHWVGEAAKEGRALMRMPRPDVPTLTFLGTLEQVVSITAINRIHADWPSAELRLVEGAKHELLMEAPAIRAQVLSQTLEFLAPDRIHATR